MANISDGNCVHDLSIMLLPRKIHSYLENDAGNWTCVALASPMGSQHLWLLDESDDTDMNMALLKSTGSCSSDDAPAMEDAYEIEEGTWSTVSRSRSCHSSSMYIYY